VVVLSSNDRNRVRLFSFHSAELRRPGESIGNMMRRFRGEAPENLDEVPEVPLAGTVVEHVRDTRRAHLCADIQSEFRFGERDVLLASGSRSCVYVPLFVRGTFLGALYYGRLRPPPFGPHDAHLLEQISQPVAGAVANALAYQEILTLRARLARENVALRQEVAERGMFGEIVGSSSALRAVLSRVEKVAPIDTTVLILGETGTGKELIARAIHQRSPRAKGPLVSVNCAALSPGLIASELFGHERGAFTGATQRREGRFELAAGGTIFLDEIGDLPPDLQVALLRVLQEQEFERVGGSRTLRTDVRVVAATHRDLRTAVAQGSFREDLYYRLSVFPIELPPLRERRDDIPALVEYFARRFSERRGLKYIGVDPESLGRMMEYDWPGNVRELGNLVERGMILSDGGPLRLDEQVAELSPAPRPEGSWIAPAVARANLREGLRAQEKKLIEEALEACEGRVAGARGAARRLGTPPTTLDNKIRLFGIDKARFRPKP
jgi:formate hydrogenlyase transcriptional activator